MDLVSYIYDFLHDPYRDRWAIDRVNFAIDRARDELEARAKAFINLRELKRERAKLSKLEMEDRVAKIQLLNGKDTYKVPDEDLVVIKSVIYNGCFIEHSKEDCSKGDCTERGELVRGYATIGLPKGVIKLFPTPQTKLKVCDVVGYVSKIKPEYEKYICPTPTQEDDKEYRFTGYACGDTVCCGDTELERVVEDYSQYGWGFLSGEKPYYYWRERTKEPETQPEPETQQEDEVIEFTLGELEVNYQVKKVVEYPDNDDEIVDLLTNDIEAIKLYVCGNLLRDDRDSHSRSLGNEELQYFEKRVTLLLSRYEELYETDDILELQAQESDNVSTKVSDMDLKNHEIHNEHERLALEEDSMKVKYDANHSTRQRLKEDIDKNNQRTCKNRFESLGTRMQYD